LTIQIKKHGKKEKTTRKDIETKLESGGFGVEIRERVHGKQTPANQHIMGGKNGRTNLGKKNVGREENEFRGAESVNCLGVLAKMANLKRPRGAERKDQ